MKERSEDILEAAIESFIKFGEPISSSWLYKQYSFGIKPAMIRHELEELTEEGFLEQPYRSSGRIPSDFGYEFFAEKVLSRNPEIVSNSILVKYSNWPVITGWIANELDTLGVLSQPSERTIYKCGLENLIGGLSWDSPSEIKQIINDFEEIDNRVKETSKFAQNCISIFIGEKSPVTKSKNLAVVMRTCHSDNGPVVIMAIGSKRMNYKKAVKTLADIYPRKFSHRKTERIKN